MSEQEIEVDDLPEQIAVRMQKRERLNQTSSAYLVSLPITHTIDGVRAAYPDLEIDTATGEKVALAGRIVFQRGYFDQLSFFRQQGLAVPDRYLG